MYAEYDSGGEAMMMDMAMESPVPQTESVFNSQSSSGSKQTQLVKVRKNFPETWLWEQRNSGYVRTMGLFVSLESGGSCSMHS